MSLRLHGPHPKPAPRPNRQRKPMNRGTVAFKSRTAMKRATRPMRHRSLTNSRAVAWRELYLPARLVFLAAHPDCEMRIDGECPPYPHPATEIQHMVQVSLDPSIENLLDETRWLASCHRANSWCGIHPQEAEALGLEVRPDWSKAVGRTDGGAG